ncbi:MAG TPA: phosphopantetheine-binding protein [Nocardioidaceae bacterium]|jgi:acyl carrier protein|nr:phosphopantetheine-binding protein [Nocardioidaceae bacterium]
MSITQDEGRDMVARAVREIVPDADVGAVSPDADLRRTFELDSLDFLSFVELLVKDSGVRIDEDDYPELATTAGCVDFLVRRSS